MSVYCLKEDGYYRDNVKVSGVEVEEETGERYYFTYNKLEDRGTFGNRIIDSVNAVKKDMADKILVYGEEGNETYAPIRFYNRDYGKVIRQKSLKEFEKLELYYVIKGIKDGETCYLRSNMTLSSCINGARRLRREDDTKELLGKAQTLYPDLNLRSAQVSIDKRCIINTADIYKVASRRYDEIKSVEAVTEWLNEVINCTGGRIETNNGVLYLHTPKGMYALSRTYVEHFSLKEGRSKEFLKYLGR